MISNQNTDTLNGPSYLWKGFELIQVPGIRPFVIIPFIINLILFSVSLFFLFQKMEQWITELMAWLPSFLSWLDYLIWPLAVIFMLLGSAMIFTTIMNAIAAPFNGLLSEKVEQHLTGVQVEGVSWGDFCKDIPRLFMRELTKLVYFIPRTLLFLLLWFVPVIGGVLWFSFSAWMMAIQYLDYPFDNHKIAFTSTRQQLWQKKGQSFSFGAVTALLMMVPLLNMFMMPIAICGATALWVDHHRAANTGSSEAG